MKLNDIGIKYGCDKSDVHHTFKEQTYLDIYESYFHSLKDEPIRFLELGVRNGSSVKIWEEYFQKADLILGVDVMQECKAFEKGKIKIEIGSQADPEFINKIISTYAPFHIILDDASHINELSITSFNLLKDSLSPNGMYIIEDLRNSYEDLTEDVKSWPGMHLNKNTNFNNSVTRINFNHLLLSIIKDLDYRTSEFRSVKFHSQLVILCK